MEPCSPFNARTRAGYPEKNCLEQAVHVNKHSDSTLLGESKPLTRFCRIFFIFSHITLPNLPHEVKHKI